MRGAGMGMGMGAPRPPWKAAGPAEEEQDLAGRAGGRKKGAWVRAWLTVDAAGQAEVVEAGKHSIMRRAGLPARDLRILDPLLSYPSTVLGRERAIVVNLEHIKAVITATEVLLLNYREVEPFVRELQSRILHRHHRLHGGADEQEGETGGSADWSNVYDLEKPRSRTASPPCGSDNVNSSGGLQENKEASKEGKGVSKSNIVNSDGPRFLPFEFVALEACLESACSCLENEATILEKEAHPALDKLTSKISTLNLERVRQIKSRLVAITGRVQKVRDELEHLLDDDEDMAEMYLTEKLMQQRLSNESPLSSNEQGDDMEDERLTDDTSLEEKDIHNSYEDYSQNIDNHDHLLSGPSMINGDGHGTQTCSARSGSKHLDIDELEMLLEAYFVQIDSTLNKLSTLREYVDDTEDYINIMLDDKQNHLLQMGVVLTTATLVVSAFVVLVGIFGMNIQVDLFDQKKSGMTEFMWTVGGGATGSLLLYILSIAWCKHRRLLE